MKEIVPEPPAVVQNRFRGVQELFQRNVVPSYGRFELAIERGSGSSLWDVNGRRYLDFGGGIAVCSLGHANPDITAALVEQSQKLVHVSNLYYTEPQGRFAEELVRLIAPGKVFFCNSGAEANEGLYKLARKFGHDEGRFEIITAFSSFHGRTLAGIAATGQDKVKKGFEPMVAGFKHVPYNDLEAVRAALTPATVAVLIEGIQGEGGVTPARPDYLLGLRQLCDERKMLLLMDDVQAGCFRTGRFASYQRILEDVPGAASFLPDGLSMAKSLGGGFPIGAFWVREPHQDLLGPGTHATTFGGTPLGCAVGRKVLEVVRRDQLDRRAREMGESLRSRLKALQARFPNVIKDVRGFGLMMGLQVADDLPAFAKVDKSPAIQCVNALHQAGLLTVPAGTNVIRLLPALTLSDSEANEGLGLIEKVVSTFAAS